MEEGTEGDSTLRSPQGCCGKICSSIRSPCTSGRLSSRVEEFWPVFEPLSGLRQMHSSSWPPRPLQGSCSAELCSPHHCCCRSCFRSALDSSALESGHRLPRAALACALACSAMGSWAVRHSSQLWHCPGYNFLEKQAISLN